MIFLGFLSTVLGLEVLVSLQRYLEPKAGDKKQGGVVRLGHFSDYAPGSVTSFEAERFYLIRTEEGGFLAVYRRCPHLGCTVHWEGDHDSYLCPCHASRFDFYGNFEKAPVTRALDYYELSIEDEMIEVDTSRLKERLQFDPDQLVFPKSLSLST